MKQKINNPTLENCCINIIREILRYIFKNNTTKLGINNFSVGSFGNCDPLYAPSFNQDKLRMYMQKRDLKAQEKHEPLNFPAPLIFIFTF